MQVLENNDLVDVGVGVDALEAALLTWETSRQTSTLPSILFFTYTNVF